MFLKLGVKMFLKFANFIEKHLCWSLFLMRLQAPRLRWILKNYCWNQFFKETVTSNNWPRKIWIWFSSRWKAPMVQHPETAARKCSVNKVLLKNRKIHGKAPMLESLFNKVTGAETCFPANFAKFSYRTAPVAATDHSGLNNFASNSNGTSFVKENYHDFIQS